MNKFILFIATACSLLGCGQVIEATPTPKRTPPTSDASATESRTIVVGANVGFGSAAGYGVALDFSNANGVSDGLRASPGRPNAQVVSSDDIREDFRGLCERAPLSNYSKWLNDVYRPLDIGFVSKMRIDIQSPGGPPLPEDVMCFAVHTKATGWIVANKVGIVVDSTGPRGGREPPGAGHFDISVNIDNIDMLLLVAGNSSGGVISKFTYDAIPRGAP
jgi:hypothetical protein